MLEDAGFTDIEVVDAPGPGPQNSIDLAHLSPAGRSTRLALPDELAISVIAVAELRVGVLAATDPANP